MENHNAVKTSLKAGGVYRLVNSSLQKPFVYFPDGITTFCSTKRFIENGDIFTFIEARPLVEYNPHLNTSPRVGVKIIYQDEIGWLYFFIPRDDPWERFFEEVTKEKDETWK